MSVWFCIPSKRPAAEAQACIDKWLLMGYRVAVWRDIGDDVVDCDYIRYGEYPGYARAVNALAKDVLAYDTACDWIVTGGDDTDPDQTKRADEIAAECSAHFAGTFGVMQPTGDRFADGSIDRIAGSPWIGREFCERMNGGQGPYWPEYTHMFVDEYLQHLALKLGVFWQRRDLTHLHHHFMRASDAINSPVISRAAPPHLREANSAVHWHKYKALFERQKANGFAECMPAVEVCA